MGKFEVQVYNNLYEETEQVFKFWDKAEAWECWFNMTHKHQYDSHIEVSLFRGFDRLAYSYKNCGHLVIEE